MTTAFLVASHQMRVQFCSNGVTGTMIAPAFALLSALVSVFSVMAPSMPIFAGPPSQSFVLFGGNSHFPMRPPAHSSAYQRARCHTGAAIGPDPLPDLSRKFRVASQRDL